MYTILSVAIVKPFEYDQLASMLLKFLLLFALEQIQTFHFKPSRNYSNEIIIKYAGQNAKL